MIQGFREFAEKSWAALPLLVISPSHRGAGCILAHALSANIPEGWAHCTDHWMERLTEGEIFGIGYAALSGLSPEARQAAYELAQYGQTQPRMPSPSWGNPMADARWWARFASRADLKAYLVAAYWALPSKVRASFRAYAEANP